MSLEGPGMLRLTVRKEGSSQRSSGYCTETLFQENLYSLAEKEEEEEKKT